MKPRYPHPLFDHLMEVNDLPTDFALSMETGIAQALISKIRSGRIELRDSVRVKIMRRFGLTIDQMDKLAPPQA